MPGILVGIREGLDLRPAGRSGCPDQGPQGVWVRRNLSEQVSAVAQRDRLKEALRFVRRGDTPLACKPNRLARSTTDLLRIVEDLDWRGVGLIMLSMGGQKITTGA